MTWNAKPCFRFATCPSGYRGGPTAGGCTSPPCTGGCSAESGALCSKRFEWAEQRTRVSKRSSVLLRLRPVVRSHRPQNRRRKRGSARLPPPRSGCGVNSVCRSNPAQTDADPSGRPRIGTTGFEARQPRISVRDAEHHSSFELRASALSNAHPRQLGPPFAGHGRAADSLRCTTRSAAQHEFVNVPRRCGAESECNQKPVCSPDALNTHAERPM